MPSTHSLKLTTLAIRSISRQPLLRRSQSCAERMHACGVVSGAARATMCGLARGRALNGRPRDRRMLWLGADVVCRHFRSAAIGRGGGFGRLEEIMGTGFRTLCTEPYSVGAAPDLSLDEVVTEGQLTNSVSVSTQKSPGVRTLVLLSGSFYMPHPDKEATGGEDAHFICTEEQAIGVADGVGGWADQGIDAGKYARQLMSNSVTAIREQMKGHIDTGRVLEKAYSQTKELGSSTACIIALTDQGVHAVNIGDSGFIVVRDGSTIFRSPVQQHEFNMPYQLDSGGLGDLPSAAQIFNFPVQRGDVIVAGTDGLFDNLYTNEIAAVVVNATRAKLGPQVLAQKIAELARQRALDNKRQTPFSTAAQHAGYRYHGGKLDDVSVVVSYVTAASSA